MQKEGPHIVMFVKSDCLYVIECEMNSTGKSYSVAEYDRCPVRIWTRIQ